MRICLSFLVSGFLVSVFAGEVAAPVVVPEYRRVATVRPDASSGRLVRTVVVQPRVVQPVVIKEGVGDPEPAPIRQHLPSLAADASLREIVEHTAQRYNVDPLLVHSVIQVESGYNKYAVSPKGAQGLMQLIPSTARRLGVKNPFDPKENIEAGVRYLKLLQTMFKDDRLALAAYNAGEGAVARHGWIPPYAETRNYVFQVGKRYGQARRAVQKPGPPAGQAQAAPKIEQFIDGEGRLHVRSR